MDSRASHNPPNNGTLTDNIKIIIINHLNAIKCGSVMPLCSAKKKNDG